MGQSAPGSSLRPSCAYRAIQLLLVVAMVLPASGCVRRRLNVRTNPPGALVYVDNQQIGTTPCSVDFTYYGTREIRLVKSGFETLTVNQPIPAPWWQYPGIDFVSENLVAMKIRDNRTVTYNLAPQVVVPTQEIVDRGNQLRQDALQYSVAQAAATTPVVVAPGSPVIVPGPGPAPIVGPPTIVPGPAPVVAPPAYVPQRLPEAYPAPAGVPVAPTKAVELLPPPPM